MEALLYEILDDLQVQCKLCSHYCIIKPGKAGICKVRENLNGVLHPITWGKAGGAALDPIEKKPFFHYKPESNALSFGAPGCNFKCLNCQNSSLSQNVKYYKEEVLRLGELTPKDIVRKAIAFGADGIAYTYSEPTVFFEYVRDTVLLAKETTEAAHMFHVFISNGYFSPETLDLIHKENLLDAINIDLKFMDTEKYQKITGGKLGPVLNNIKKVWELRDIIQLEIINLVIPGENDSEDDLMKISEFLASVSTEIPLHFNRFHPCYEMSDKPPTDIKRLLKAREIAKNLGMKYVYIGNTGLEDTENTYCPKCGELLISRSRFGVINNKFKGMKDIKNPKCPKCGESINLIL